MGVLFGLAAIAGIYVLSQAAKWSSGRPASKPTPAGYPRLQYIVERASVVPERFTAADMRHLVYVLERLGFLYQADRVAEIALQIQARCAAMAQNDPWSYYVCADAPFIFAGPFELTPLVSGASDSAIQPHPALSTPSFAPPVVELPQPAPGGPQPPTVSPEQLARIAAQGSPAAAQETPLAPSGAERRESGGTP